MTVRPVIYLDDPLPRPDDVTLAVLPIDGVTGEIVRRGVKARVRELPNPPIVNGSGMLVFINLPAPPNPPKYWVEVDPTEAGFFTPDPVSYDPPAANDDEAKRRLSVILKPRPDYPFPSGTTLVRGVVVRGNQVVSKARISAQPPPGSVRFEALTDDRGAFALALRPHPHGPTPLQLAIRLEDGPDFRNLARTLTPGRSHSFRDPVNLIDNEEPDFFTI